ncbi:MAG TPA: HupE/UreJ family protein [Methylocella sp.]|nr:HupE/UreJ family protein [Methylocella sp.]
MKHFILLLCVLMTLISTATSPVLAHKSSDSYLSLRVDGERILGQWDVALRDLDYALGLDLNDDGVITWGEVHRRHEDIASLLLSSLKLRADGKICPARSSEHLIDVHSDGAYEVFRFAADCPETPLELQINYDFFFNFDPQHRGLLRLDFGKDVQTAVFSPLQRNWRTQRDGVDFLRTFVAYVNEGIWHIWTGFDHILFLSALLLPAVLTYSKRRWVAVTRFSEAFRNVIAIVTAFTIAHSITLSLAVFGYISLPSRLVESAIAISVIAAALNNLRPIVQRRLWAVAFIFGLVHGLGFANVLIELGLPKKALAIALIGFNLGVEVGQLAIVGAILPAAYLLRFSWFYPRIVLSGGSLCIAMIATVWLLERSLNLSLIS